MQVLKLSLFGSFQVTLTGSFQEHGEPLTGFAYDKVRALLAYLVVESARPHRREKLATLLWAEDSPEAARTSLRKALSTLRRAIQDKDTSPAYLIVRHDTVQFNPASNYWVDVDIIKARLESSATHAHSHVETCETCIEDLEEAARLYRGDFLQGLIIKDSIPFEEWVLVYRERFHSQILTAIHYLTRYYLHQGAYAQAQKYALRQIKMEPYREEAHRTLMRTLSRSGQRSAALRQYETCKTTLAAELGVPPADKTTAL